MKPATIVGATTAYTINKFFLDVWASFTSNTFRPSTTITLQPGQTTLTTPHPVRTDIDLDLESETQWRDIANTPHVRHELLRLASEARQQAAAGETEEGGFAFEGKTDGQKNFAIPSNEGSRLLCNAVDIHAIIRIRACSSMDRATDFGLVGCGFES